MKYIKKPVAMEAFQMTKKVWEGHKSCPQWFLDAYVKNLVSPFDKENSKYKKYWGVLKKVNDFGLEGCLDDNEARVCWDEWIIKGEEGDLFSVKPDIFEQTYEEYKEKEEDELIMQEHGDDDDDNFLEGDDDFLEGDDDDRDALF